MGWLWWPGQDVDFLGRLSELERKFKNCNANQCQDSPYTVKELEAENAELRLRVDDLEDLVIMLSEEVGRLESKLL